MSAHEPIHFHETEFYPFSNFSAFAITWRGKLWPTSEHAYQGAKFNDEIIAEEIRNALSAVEAYAVAHEHAADMDPSFSERKLEVMEDILHTKLNQHAFVREKLIASSTRELIKNFEGDPYWGSGVHGTGENNLGKLWMKLREELKTEQL